MSPYAIGILGLVVLYLLMFSGMHIGFAMALVGFGGLIFIGGLHAAMTMAGLVPFTQIASYLFSVMPLFILMGTFAFYGGLNKELYDTCHRWLGHMPGGLSMATIGACAGFAAISGSSIATAATMGTVSLPEMKRHNYSMALATGCVAAGGTLGILIPPSMGFIVYGVVTEQSIGKLFMAGFIPGVTQAIFYMITIYVLCKLNPSMGPRGPRTSFMAKIASLKNSWVILFIFLLVMGGIYLGVFTPTEAGGVGVVGIFIAAVSRKTLSWRDFKNSLLDTAGTTGMVFAIIIGAMIFGYFLAVSRLSFELASFIGGVSVNPYIVLVAILCLYILLGCIMEMFSVILITVPILFPLITALGFDPIWFGVLIVRVIEIGLITPPVGMNVFIIKGVAKDVPMGTIFRGILPFFIADICHVALLVAFPQISLFLPNMMQ